MITLLPPFLAVDAGECPFLRSHPRPRATRLVDEADTEALETRRWWGRVTRRSWTLRICLGTLQDGDASVITESACHGESCSRETSPHSPYRRTRPAEDHMRRGELGVEGLPVVGAGVAVGPSADNTVLLRCHAIEDYKVGREGHADKHHARSNSASVGENAKRRTGFRMSRRLGANIRRGTRSSGGPSMSPCRSSSRRVAVVSSPARPPVFLLRYGRFTIRHLHPHRNAGIDNVILEVHQGPGARGRTPSCYARVGWAVFASEEECSTAGPVPLMALARHALRADRRVRSLCARSVERSRSGVSYTVGSAYLEIDEKRGQSQASIRIAVHGAIRALGGEEYVRSPKSVSGEVQRTTSVVGYRQGLLRMLKPSDRSKVDDDGKRGSRVLLERRCEDENMKAGSRDAPISPLQFRLTYPGSDLRKSWGDIHHWAIQRFIKARTTSQGVQKRKVTDKNAYIGGLDIVEDYLRSAAKRRRPHDHDQQRLRVIVQRHGRLANFAVPEIFQIP
ncbi:hypothetical protein C8R44DRAFT_745868 [Mycena epipterygia]|nr:hypothetical protein C8R44DRAFT_745868 [Mycena epipterygia]